MQIMEALITGEVMRLSLPAANEEVISGVPWGRFDELFTPAFWHSQAWQHSFLGTYEKFQLGRSLKEEVAACLLGGYGMRAEIGLAAYCRVRDVGFLEYTPSDIEIEKALCSPFMLGNRKWHYRFPRQKARHLSSCLKQLVNFVESENDLELRNQLMSLNGIGPKTASWIVRNYRHSDSVAIIDVHILRAGRLAKIFKAEETPQLSYFKLEKIFLDFANAIEAKASILDNLIWDFMRKLNRHS